MADNEEQTPDAVATENASANVETPAVESAASAPSEVPASSEQQPESDVDAQAQGQKNPRDESESGQDEPGAKKARRDDSSSGPSSSFDEAGAAAAAAAAREAAERQSQSNLFVNGLPFEHSEAQLRALFAPYGEIEAVKVMMDHATGRTKGYGFVKFRDPEEAAKAIEAMNGTKLGERELLVKVADSGRTAPRPNLHGTPSPNVYVKGLPETVNDEQLRTLFAPFGPIADTKILVDLATNVSRGQAFVRYENQSSAEYAIAALNNYTFPGTVQGIIVRFADTKEEKLQRKQKAQQRGGDSRGGGYRGGGPGFDQGYGGYYGGAAAAGGYGGYGAYGAQYGGAYGYPGYGQYGYAYAYPGYGYGQEGGAGYGQDWSGYGQGAPQGGGGGGGGGVPQPGSEGHLFIYHLPPDADDELLYRLFGPYGSILSVKVMRDAVTNNCKGFGFVKFGDPAAAAAAVAALNGYQVGNKRLQVSFKK